ncbi:MAG: DUF2207 domain-containing protein [Patescibacteria group bacterium]
MLYKARLISLIVLGIFFVGAGSVFAQGMAQPINSDQPEVEEVTSFSSDIVVGTDGTISVTERIDYYYPSARHGFYRDIPIRYETEDGETVIVPIEIVSVEGGPYELIKTRSTVRIKIGDSDQTVTGLHQYIIKYVATGALRQFNGQDELYWNVTGQDWEVPFGRVAAQVYLPDGVTQESIGLRCFTGPFGSTEQDCLYHRTKGGASFAADDLLTVVVGWQPQGLVTIAGPIYPSFWTDYIQPNLLSYLLAGLIPLGVFVYMFRKWRSHGRDPLGRSTTMVEYEPPDKLTPAEVGVLMDEQANIRDVSAVIVDLAVRGYLKIVELPKIFLLKQDYEFQLVRADFAKRTELLRHEQEILSILFTESHTLQWDKLIQNISVNRKLKFEFSSVSRQSVNLSLLVKRHAFHRELSKINNQLYDLIVERGYFYVNPETVRQKYRLIGGLLAGLCGFSGMEMLVIGDSKVFLTGLIMAALAVSGIIIVIFGRAMPKKTEAGVRAFEHAKGFREYLEKAEKYRLQWQEKENVFEKYLPYAMVFGVAHKWSEAFKNIDMAPPEWYQGSAFTAGHFNAGLFLSSISGLESGLMRAVSSSPQKNSGGSGFSGGGSSGGGFGGGGGGSW